MGTRSLTYFYDRLFDKESKEALACFYRQMDGYPDCHGRALATFLKDMKVVNGYSGGQDAPAYANGTGCLAAQVIAHFKAEHGIGSIYMRRPDEGKYNGQEFEYRVYVDSDTAPQIRITVFQNFRNKEIFDGSPTDMLDWCDKCPHGVNEENDDD
jgi:hypothetical protein